MKGIIPYLWCNDNAEEMVKFYTDLFPDSRTGQKVPYTEASSQASGQPLGSTMSWQFWLLGQEFVALNGGDHFKFTPSVSFSVDCHSEEFVQRLWDSLSAGGAVLMPLQKYPFSELYGWVQDKFGLSWQLNLNGRKPKVIPSLLFVGDLSGKAKEASELYVEIF